MFDWQFLGMQDPVDGVVPAIAVSAFDVTHLTETELELEAMKLKLQQYVHMLTCVYMHTHTCTHLPEWLGRIA